MSIPETFDQRQERQAARLREVCRAAAMGATVAGPAASQVARSSPSVITPSSPSLAAPPVGTPTVKTTARVDPTPTWPDAIGFGWDAVVDELNRKIAAQYGNVHFHTRDAENDPTPPAVDDRYGWAAAAERINAELLHAGHARAAPGASSWDDAVDRVNAQYGVLPK